MKTIKGIVGVLIGLFFFYLVISFGWSILNAQTCTTDYPKNPTCEQSAQYGADNCKYVILRWKKVDYNKELQKCKAWEQKNNRQ